MISLLLMLALGSGTPAPVVDRAPKERPDAGVVLKKKDKDRKKDHGARAEEE